MLARAGRLTRPSYRAAAIAEWHARAAWPISLHQLAVLQTLRRVRTAPSYAVDADLVRLRLVHRDYAHDGYRLTDRGRHALVHYLEAP